MINAGMSCDSQGRQGQPQSRFRSRLRAQKVTSYERESTQAETSSLPYELRLRRM